MEVAGLDGRDFTPRRRDKLGGPADAGELKAVKSTDWLQLVQGQPGASEGLSGQKQTGHHLTAFGWRYVARPSASR